MPFGPANSAASSLTSTISDPDSTEPLIPRYAEAVAELPQRSIDKNNAENTTVNKWVSRFTTRSSVEAWRRKVARIA